MRQLMSQLRGYQDAFKSNLLNEKPDRDFLDLLVEQSAGDAPARINIYRNNVLHSLSCALGDLYPVVKRLTGDRCFDAAAVSYLREHPPEHAALVFYGESFVDFISTYPACSQLGYLADTARLEWLCHVARNAADSEYLDVSRLAEIPGEKLGTLGLIPHPSVQLLESRWPVDDIQMENLKAEPGIVDLDKSTERYLLIWRDALNIRVIALEESCYQLLRSLILGHSIETSWQQISCQGSADELTSMLGYLLGLHLFIDFNIQEDQ